MSRWFGTRHLLFFSTVAVLLAGAGAVFRQEPIEDWTPPKRTTKDCAGVRKELEDAGKSYDVKVKPGWGKVPKELQKVPPGGELCGVDSVMGQAIVKSSLYGKDLQAFVTPLFEKVGCKPVTCSIVESKPYRQTRCKCRRPGGVGAATTNVSVESFSIGTM
jgi:hypothetical protein